jgi:hypothetical protein
MSKSPAPAVLDSAKKSERRVWKRFPIYTEVNCQTNVKGQPPWSALVLNISRGGLKLVSAHRLEAGSLVRIGVAGGTSLSARVVHVAPEEGGMWSMGCAFTPKLSEDQLRDWVQRGKKEK